MSGSFFQDLDLPLPDIKLEVGSGSHAQQTAAVMLRLEPVLLEFKPDIMIVVGDVNSTLAGALTAKKIGIRVAHVEAGLRSFDMSMPEEINRICTDAISDYLFTTDRMANENLLREGVSPDRIYFVGNVMIDSLLAWQAIATGARTHERLGVEEGRYATLTLHRPSNVDTKEKLSEILSAVMEVSSDFPIVFPVHPRTRRRVEDFGLQRFLSGRTNHSGIWMIEPLGYIEFLSLNMSARLALTDSGGVQEETTILGIPCVTLRDNTERPITVIQGTNRLGGTNRKSIIEAISAALAQSTAEMLRPENWDGKASERIAQIISTISVQPN
jgi:UDP-N-acetylglucosamine 2-epimerase (non-hydrolysing)